MREKVGFRESCIESKIMKINMNDFQNTPKSLNSYIYERELRIFIDSLRKTFYKVFTLKNNRRIVVEHTKLGLKIII